MEQKVADNESVARILNNAWFEEGELLHIAFRQRKDETYISVNRPAVNSYSADVEDKKQKLTARYERVG